MKGIANVFKSQHSAVKIVLHNWNDVIKKILLLLKSLLNFCLKLILKSLGKEVSFLYPGQQV